MSTGTYWLSFHAPYACRHSGACCSSGWDIAIERPRVQPVLDAVASGRIAAPAQWYRTVDDAPDEVAGVLTFGDGGRCVFHRARRCAIHAALGHAAMPAACQHFPRIALIDPRGIFVTLSHYCPTAASLLFDAVDPVSIVEGPPALPNGDTPEGLDARDALPPLESPRRLMDWASYDAWERHAVRTLTSGVSPRDALDALDPAGRGVSDEALLDIARDAVPLPYSWSLPGVIARADWTRPAPVIGRYLAAHVFASWAAYQGTSLRAIVLSLRLVLAVLASELARGRTLFEAVRHADLLVRHLVDRQRLADGLSALAVR